MTKVVSVNTMRYDGKRKARYTKGIYCRSYPAFKKAIVTLEEGQSIDFWKYSSSIRNGNS